MMSQLRLAIITASVAVVAAMSGSAFAQSVTLSFEDPVPGTPGLEPQPINDEMRVFIDYSLPASYYENVVIELVLPHRQDYPWTSFVTQNAPAGWTFTTTTTPNGFSQVLRWTIPALTENQAVSGRITATVRFLTRQWHVNQTYRSLSETVYPFTATLSGGSSASPSGPFAQFSDVEQSNRTATGTPDVSWHVAHATFYGSYNATNGGEAGIVQRFGYVMKVCGNAGIMGSDFGSPNTGGMEWTITRGAGNARFHRVWSGPDWGIWPTSAYPPSSALDPSFTVLTADITTATSVNVRMDQPLTPYPGGCEYSKTLYVDVFVPCGAGALTFPSMTVESGPAYQPVWNGVGAQPIAGDAFSLPTLVAAASPRSACGDLHPTWKYSDGTTGRGVTIQWNLVFGPPYGVATVSNALLVDRLPAGITNPELVVPALLVDWTSYHCANVGSEFFDVTTLLAAVGDGRCVASTVDSTWRRPPTPTHPTHGAWTHIALHAATWGGNTTIEGAVRPIDVTLYTYLPANYDTNALGSQVRNYLQFSASYVDSGNNVISYGNTTIDEPSGSDDPFEAHATRTVIDYGCGGVTVPPTSQGDVTTLAPGQCGRLLGYMTMVHTLEPPRNASISVDVPDGVTITNLGLMGGEPAPVDGVWFAGSCVEGPLSSVISAPTDNPLLLQLGTSGNPCSYLSWYVYSVVEFCLDEDYPWVDGQSVPFEVNYLGADNEGTAQQCSNGSGTPILTQSSAFSFTAAVPPEMRLTVNPACIEGAGPAFLVQGSNTGGQNLTEVELRFRVPNDATFAGVVPVSLPAGHIIEVSGQDPPVTWGPVGSVSPVRWVRVLDPVAPGLQIAPQTGAPISFYVTLTTSLADGSLLQGGGLMLAAELGDAPAEAQPFTVGSCRFVNVQKFWDVNMDGIKAGADEIGIEGWSFQVTAENGAVVGSGQTDETGGGLSFYLPAGVYTVTELMPSGSTPTWQVTTPAGSPSTSQTVTITIGGPDLQVVFGNACSCTPSNSCSVASCELVSQAGEPMAFGCVETPLCGPSDMCNDVTCVDGDCIVTPIVACDPAVTYYLPVRDTVTGETQAIRCLLSTVGAPPVCDTNPDGSLTLYPEFAGACGG